MPQSFMICDKYLRELFANIQKKLALDQSTWTQYREGSRCSTFLVGYSLVHLWLGDIRAKIVLGYNAKCILQLQKNTHSLMSLYM